MEKIDYTYTKENHTKTGADLWATKEDIKFEYPKEINSIDDINEKVNEPSQEEIKEAIEVLEMSIEFAEDKNEFAEAIEVLQMLIN